MTTQLRPAHTSSHHLQVIDCLVRRRAHSPAEYLASLASPWKTPPAAASHYPSPLSRFCPSSHVTRIRHTTPPLEPTTPPLNTAAYP